MKKLTACLLFLSNIHLLLIIRIGCCNPLTEGGAMKTSFYSYIETSDGARIRYRYWPSPGRCNGRDTCKNILIMQGRASFMEKFNNIISGLRDRNYRIWSFDWRGQGLSSRVLADPHKGHIDSYDTYLKDLDQLVHEVILPKIQGPLIVLGQSMGAHLALRYMEQRPEIVDLSVLVAPMLDLKTGAYSKQMARFLANFMTRIGFHESYVFGHGVYDPKKEPFEGNFLTHDRDTFFDHRNLQKENPKLSLGGVTFGWLQASFDSIDKVNQKNFLRKIKKPVLVVTAGKEAIVDNDVVPEVCKWLETCKLVTYPGSKHQILMEKKEILRQFWDDFDLFVHEHYPEIQKKYLSKGGLIETPKLSGVKRIYPTLTNNINRLKSDL